jgi:hypothetical protein
VVVVLSWYSVTYPPDCAQEAPTANTSAGMLPAFQYPGIDFTSWELARPGAPFGYPANPVFEVRTTDSAQAAKVGAMLASFRWAAARRTTLTNCGAT